MRRRGRACLSAAALLLLSCLQHGAPFNLDAERPSVFSGPRGSYFGFSVDFFKPGDKQLNVLVGAPRANTSAASSVTERGAVYSCPWQASQPCKQVAFDATGELNERKNTNGEQMEFKSNQWFGATVRSDGEHILACAPLYQWSTYGLSEREPVGTCYLKKGGNIVEYSPCRSSSHSPEGQGFCQAGFMTNLLCNGLDLRCPSSSAGQLISDDISEIINKFNGDFITPYSEQLTTKPAGPQYDDSYLGYSVTVGDFNNDGEDVATTDINNDGKVDLFVGAPLFMDRGSDGKLREVGQVYVYLGKGEFFFHTPQKLTGSEIYARFGSSIASLGDVDMDGFNDVAIGAPYGGLDHRGLVYIHNGRATGPDPVASQVLEGKWVSAFMPPSFGYSMHGATDIDLNGYPECLLTVHPLRARPVISVNTTLDITPQILNPVEKSCTLPGTSNFQIDLVLDRLKHKGAVKRVLFLHSRQSQYSKNMTVSNGRGPACEELEAYLIDDSEFRDKITPIAVFMEYKLDYGMAADKTGLLPILDQSTPANVTRQAHILLDCGEDNICKPDLKLSVVSDQKQIYIGDDNPLTLQVTAENSGEGAYEAELRVIMPPQADFIGVVRNSETLSRLSCAYKKENQTRVVVCDLGNPMKGGTKVLAGLRFSVHQLSEQDTSVKFDLQMHSSNQFNNTSNLVSSVTKLAVLARVEIRGVSAPDQVFLPIAKWQPKENPQQEDDIGPLVLNVYELRNKGPSTFSKAMLDIEVPYKYNNGSVLYITKYTVDGAMNCTPECTDHWEGGDRANRNHVHRRDLERKQMDGDLQTLDCEKAQCLKIKCQVGRLERGQSAILFINSRLSVATFLKSQNQSYIVRSSATFNVIEMPYKNLVSEFPSNSTAVNLAVIWVKTDYAQPVPGWVVALAVLAGLLLLALLIFVMYKLGFFKRVRPPQEDCTEKEQLQPHENGERNTEA
uniref:Integrin alpha-2 domain-containing protein n=1 Tax=Denticeps clupeoides TaxID=299321 RepID=A0AAY4EP35_9TELE